MTKCSIVVRRCNTTMQLDHFLCVYFIYRVNPRPVYVIFFIFHIQITFNTCIQASNRQLWRCYCSTHHHIQFSKFYCSGLPPSLSCWYPQQDGLLHLAKCRKMYKLGGIGWLGCPAGALINVDNPECGTSVVRGTTGHKSEGFILGCSCTQRFSRRKCLLLDAYKSGPRFLNKETILI